MANAVYYNDLYLLLPEEYPDFEDFQNYLRSCTFPIVLPLVVLRENHKIPCWTIFKGESIAPYFLTGFHDEPSQVRFLDSERIYPVQVELMDQDSYNTKLREVINGFCPGCKRFKPLSNRVQSLNGHHGEISLNGVCFYRYEENPSPRVFHDLLFSFGGFFIRNKFEQLSAEEMKEKLSWMYLRYKSYVLEETACEKYLTLECKKGELITPLLTKFAGRYIEEVADEQYHLVLKNGHIDTPESLDGLLLPENREPFQKECKKYGVSIGILEFDPLGADEIQYSLGELIDHYYLETLVSLPGKIYFLITDTSYVLKALHYRAPFLENYHTTLNLYGQKERRSYTISFDMISKIL